MIMKGALYSEVIQTAQRLGAHTKDNPLLNILKILK